eukprot:TRINITY_DN1943_c0_g2_i1.p1 TRINITY_DN1943_c0_g2~~TRINITY_DN1943_c0_g2_i1.p1  ORF type:complete len:491 (+),score=94.49 TRINITY_DN1943_c0_g2_i1:188-1660(+)
MKRVWEPNEGKGAGKIWGGFDSSVGDGKSPKSDVRPGDWTCPKCAANNFTGKTACYRCQEPKPPEGTVVKDDPNVKRSKFEGYHHEDDPTEAPPTFKILAPKTLASTINFSRFNIEKAAQSKITVTEPNELYPGTEQQIVTVSSSEWRHIHTAMRQILSMVNNSSECVMPGFEKEKRLAVVLSARAISSLIGIKGCKIKELQERTGCHVHVDTAAVGKGPAGERAVNVNGAELEGAIDTTIDIMEELYTQPWFPKWALRSHEERLDKEVVAEYSIRRTGGKGEGDGKGGCGMDSGCGMVGSGMGMGALMGMGAGCEGGTMGGGMMGCGGMNGGMMGNCMGACGMDGGMLGNCMGSGGMDGCMMGGCGGCGGCGMQMGGCNGCGGCGMMGGGKSSTDPGASMVRRIVEEMPPFATADPRGFMIRSGVPGEMAEILQSKAYQVMEMTGCNITFADKPNSKVRIMTLQGPLFSITGAYMLMMRSYLEIEKAAS